VRGAGEALEVASTSPITEAGMVIVRRPAAVLSRPSISLPLTSTRLLATRRVPASTASRWPPGRPEGSAEDCGRQASPATSQCLQKGTAADGMEAAMSGHDPLGTSQGSSQATSQQGAPTEALGSRTSQAAGRPTRPPGLESLSLSDSGQAGRFG